MAHKKVAVGNTCHVLYLARCVLIASVTGRWINELALMTNARTIGSATGEIGRLGTSLLPFLFADSACLFRRNWRNESTTYII